MRISSHPDARGSGGFIPCFAKVLAMCKRTGMKTALAMTAAINVSAVILAGTFYWILMLTGR